MGLVVAQGLQTEATHDAFEVALKSLFLMRKNPLNDTENAVREAARKMLRNGAYKPTGRGKPASEYLMRAAEDESAFPRINAPVDVNNFISLKYLLPISLWDTDLAQADVFSFRLGRADESYVFNSGGQEIALKDLVIGCAGEGETARPIVNPIKDSLATKTTPKTRNIAAVIYAPSDVVSAEKLLEICTAFAGWLGHCGTAVKTAFGIACPQESVVLTI